MKYDPEIHHRRSMRLKGYDYSRPGAYFVTICVKNRECLFGEVSKGEMRLNDTGRVVWSVWEKVSGHYSHISLDAFVVMPNHVHGIIIIGELRRGEVTSPLQKQNQFQSQSPLHLERKSPLGQIVAFYKYLTTKIINQNRNAPGVPLWQRNYYEHAIRNDVELNRIQEYIKNNPLKWHLDRENPQRTGNDPLEVDIFGKVNRLEKARSVWKV